MKIAYPAALLFSAACNSALAAPDVIPLNFIHGLPFVDVKIGAATAHMMFDSGGKLGLSVARTTVAKSGSVKLLKTRYRFQDLKGQTFEVSELMAHRVRIGATELGQVKGRVHVKWGGGAATGPEAELTRARKAGAVGLEPFANRPLLFDYQRGSMTIFEAGKAPQLPQSLPLEYGNEGPYIILHSGGKPLKFVLDTGTPVNLLDRKALDCAEKCQLADLRDANGNGMLAQQAESIDLGGAPFDGILGAPFFQSYRVLFDLKAKQLQLSANEAKEDETQVYMMSGELNYVGALSAEANKKLFALYDAQAKKPTILSIRSPGGNTELGMALGQWVHQHKLDVKVMESCNSSCANYVFTAARNKIVSSHAVVGYHGGLSSASFGIDQAMLENLAIEFGGDLEKARAEANALTKKEIAPQLEREVKFFETIGVQQRITTLGEAEKYKKAAPENAVGWYYGIDDFAKLGVANITVINPPWQPKLLASDRTVFKVTVE